MKKHWSISFGDFLYNLTFKIIYRLLYIAISPIRAAWTASKEAWRDSE